MDPRMKCLEHITPSQFISFTFPNPNPNPNPTAAPSPQSNSNNYNPYPHPLLRIAVLDSPIISKSPSSHHHPPPPPPPPVVSAMLVPVGREDDWIFSTQTGHLHLLLSSFCSRLILVGNLPSQPQSEPKPYARSISDPDPIHQLQSSILPLLLALSPKSAFSSGIPHIPFLSYHDDVARIFPVDHLVGPVAGEMLVEDVELDGGESRRRLRFKRMPNLVQSQVRLVTNGAALDATGGTSVMFRPEMGSLVQPYLGPMVAGLYLLVGPTTKTMNALCIGVGGGDLLMCLRHHLGFNVVGVEADDVVLRVAKRHFGLIEDDSLVVVIDDGIELMESASGKEISDSFDVIMVDLDSGDASGGISAPPEEFVRSSVLLGARLALREKGIMVVNVIPPSDCFYKRLVDSLREVFAELYEIDIGNGENYVVVAVASPLGRGEREKNNGPFAEKLKKLGVDKYPSCLNKI